MRYLLIGMLFLALAPVAYAQYPDPWGMGDLERGLQDSYSRQREREQQQNYEQERQEQQTRQREQQRQQQSYEQERQRNYQQEQQRYEQERRQATEDAVRRERAIQSERRGEPAPGREIYKFGR